MERSRWRQTHPNKAIITTWVLPKGNLDECFSLEPANPNAVNPLWPIFESYPESARNRLTLYKPANQDDAIFLHPGELVFDYLWGLIDTQFEAEASRRGDSSTQPPRNPI